MKTFLIILGLLLAAVSQTTVLPFLAISGIVPNLVLVLTLLLVIFRDFKKTWWLVILGGLFLDLFSGLSFGLIGLSLLTTAYFISRFNQSIFPEAKFWIVLFLIGLASLFYGLVLFGLAKLFILINLSQQEIYLSLLSLNYLVGLLIPAFYNMAFLICLYGIKKIFYPASFSK